MNLRKILFALPVFALFSCGGNSEPGDGTDTSAITGPLMVDSASVTSSNAAQAMLDEHNPESVTRYFYASRIREDESWESVCHLPSERAPKFVQNLAELDQKHIIRYTHLETNWLETTCNVHIELEWTDDSMDSATKISEHIVFLENIDGIWWIIGFSDSVEA